MYSCLHGQYSASATIDNLNADFERIRLQFHMPGLSGLAMKNGEIVGQGEAGFRRQGNPSSLLVTDRINIGSCSKWMTATVAGRLVDRGLISWTTPIHTCFPNYTSFNCAFRSATLEQLLSHRAGIQQSTTFYARHYSELLAQNGTIRQIRRWVAETVMKDVPEVIPGEFLYSNQGYAVAAAMMEFVTNQDWESLVKQHIFDPLQMVNSSIGRVYDDIIPPKAPVGHNLRINQTVPIPRPADTASFLYHDQAAAGPGGYIASTLSDWAKFLYAHINNNKTNYLSAETAAKLKHPYMGIEGYGLGINAYNRSWATPGQSLTHGGDIFGQDTVFWMAPSRGVVTVAYTNCDSEDDSESNALDATANILLSRYVY
ncbi:unnamed protein product [Adineta ricciae]|uniref:Beta-lactamase-related domain-containing protein n=1 Tax=Adineta ricciae TaxID=249248 RepID=A0A814D3Y8_ADIRI|nr:unnamed protein product [Adineta ricciae]CAF1659620.1 unnamed protein product [Adineta ricciae]